MEPDKTFFDDVFEPVWLESDGANSVKERNRAAQVETDAGTRLRPRTSFDTIGMLAQVLVEEVYRPLPSELRSGFVITRSRIVMKAVMSARIAVGRILDMIRL